MTRVNNLLTRNALITAKKTVQPPAKPKQKLQIKYPPASPFDAKPETIPDKILSFFTPTAAYAQYNPFAGYRDITGDYKDVIKAQRGFCVVFYHRTGKDNPQAINSGFKFLMRLSNNMKIFHVDLAGFYKKDDYSSINRISIDEIESSDPYDIALPAMVFYYKGEKVGGIARIPADFNQLMTKFQEFKDFFRENGYLY